MKLKRTLKIKKVLKIEKVWKVSINKFKIKILYLSQLMYFFNYLVVIKKLFVRDDKYF